MKLPRLIGLLSLLSVLSVGAQTASQKNAVQLSATVQSSPARITLNWVAQTGTTSYTITRKLKTGTSWSSIGTASASATSYQDNTVAVGTYYEYNVARAYSGGTGYGYIAAGIQVPAPDFRGKMVLLVDNTFTSSCATQITQLISDLRADGWIVLRNDVSRTASVTSIRSIIQGHYNSDPTNVKAVYLLGHVPVPYSGNLNPDGHGDHQGAWPADGYYGEMNGTWTDNSVNNSSSQNSRNHNTPGDGDFDQSDYPSAIELQVGRVDFFEFESFQYYAGLSETQLMINYLNKAHQFKVKQFTPTFRGCVFDNFDDMSNPFGANGYRNIAALVGSSNLSDFNPNGSPFTTYIDDQSYLWTYSCGGGSWSLASNVGTTGDYANTVAFGGVFNMCFGSYFGDWNTFNNFMKAPLGSGKGLTNVWAGIPNWWFHHMGMGDNIGYSAQVSMNNTSVYSPQNSGWQGNPYNRVHLALMGDPSLRQMNLAQPSNLQIANSGGLASFTWAAASGADGYYIYDLGTGGTSIPTRVTPNVVTGTSFSSSSVPFVSGRQYMVRAVKMYTGVTGSYQNLSLGVFGTASGQASNDCLGVAGGPAVPGTVCNDNNACTTNDLWNASCQCVGTSTTPAATLTAAGSTTFCTGGSVVLNANTGSGLSYVWKRSGNTISGATSSSYTATLAGSYTVTVASGGCSTVSSALSVTVSSTGTATLSAGGPTSFCSGGNVVLNANTGTGFTYVWKRSGTTISGATSSSYTATLAGSYTVIVNNGGCSATSSAVNVSVTSGSISATLTAGGTTSFCTGGSVVLSANTGSGLSYVWKRSGTTISGATSSNYTATLAGSYTVTVTSGSCSATSAALNVTVGSGSLTATLTPYGPTNIIPGGGVLLAANQGSGYTFVWKRGSTTIPGSGWWLSAYQSGSYTVTITSGGCSATSNAINVTMGSGMVLDEPENEQEGERTVEQGSEPGPEADPRSIGSAEPLTDELNVTIYPNPFHESTTILLRGAMAGGRTTVEIRSLDGALVEEVFNGALPNGEEKRLTWNAGSRAAGLYLCRVISGERTITERLQKMD